MTTPVTIMVLLKRVDCNDGVAAYLESLITGLHDFNDRVIIVSGEVTALYGSDTRRTSIKTAALDWIVLDGFSASRPKFAHLRLILSLIRAYDVDVISPQGFSVLSVGYLLGRLSGRPVVTNFHLLQSQLSAKQRFAYRVATAACPSDRYIAMSRDIAIFFRQQCRIPERRIHEQVLGVDTDFYRKPAAEERHQARARFALNNSTLVAVLPGRMNLTKGHGVAAASVRILRTRRADIDIVCLFAGDGDERDKIEADVLRNESDRATFRFLGFVNPVTMRDAYWAADIVLLPSRIEGFPLVI
jgi:glycosyltransferase involved in cell wall biosynthesis